MIRESIVITTDLKNKPHVAPMGITFNKSNAINCEAAVSAAIILNSFLERKKSKSRYNSI